MVRFATVNKRGCTHRTVSHAGDLALGNAASTKHGLLDADRVTTLCCHDRAKIVVVVDVMRV